MPELTLRTFEVHYETPIGPNGTLMVLDKTVSAAYYQQGFGRAMDDKDGEAFVVFKDCDHKPVFTVRASSVVSVEEIRPEAGNITINVSGAAVSEADIAKVVRDAVRRGGPSGRTAVV